MWIKRQNIQLELALEAEVKDEARRAGGKGPKFAWRVPTSKARRAGGNTVAIRSLKSVELPCTAPMGGVEL